MGRNSDEKYDESAGELVEHYGPPGAGIFSIEPPNNAVSLTTEKKRAALSQRLSHHIAHDYSM